MSRSGGKQQHRKKKQKKKQQRSGGTQQRAPKGGGAGGPAPTTTIESAGNTAVAEKAEEQEPAQTWGAWLGSWFASTGEAGATHEIEGDDQQVVDGLGWSQTTDHGDGVPEDEIELPTPDVITVNLAKKDFEATFGSVQSKGAVSIDRVLSGYKGKAEFEVSNSYEETRELGSVAFLGGMLTGTFTQESSFGEKISAKGEGAWTSDEIAAKAELNAFSGYSDATKAEFKVAVGGVTIATFTGSAGTTIGAGGKLKGQLSFKGGTLAWGGQSTLSSGVGMTLEYKLEVDGAAIAGGLWTWASSWASWLWEAAGSLSEALLDEDGEPFIL